MQNIKWWKKSFRSGLKLEEKVFSFLSGEKFNTVLAYLHIILFSLFSLMLLYYIARSGIIDDLKKDSIIAVGLAHHLFLLIFACISGICFLSIWKYDINKNSSRGTLKDPTYAFLVICMVLWMTMGILRILDLKSDSNVSTSFDFWVQVLSLLNSMAFLFTIQNLNVDIRSNRRLKKWQSAYLTSNHIVVFYSLLLLSTIVLYAKKVGPFLLGVPDFIGSCVVIILFIFFIPKIFQERRISGILTRLTLISFFSLTLFYQIIYWLQGDDGKLSEMLSGFIVPHISIDKLLFAYSNLAIGIFYRFTLILVFFALITSSIVKSLRSISVEEIINSIFEANESLRHDNDPGNELWVKLRDYMGFKKENHTEFVVLFSDPARYSLEENFQYTAPPFQLARDMSVGGGSSEFPLFGVLFVLSSVYFKQTFDLQSDPIDYFKKKFINKKLGLNDDQWYTLIETLKSKKIAREKKDSETGMLFQCLNDLISGLFLHRTAKTHMFQKVVWDEEKSTLTLYFKMEVEDYKNILNKMDALTRREGPKNFGKHNVSTSLLKLNELLNPPVFKTQLFPNQENAPIPFRFYQVNEQETWYFVLEFSSQN